MGRLARILMAATAAAFASSAMAKEFRGADNHPLDYPTSQAVVYMGKLIEERTKGRHKLKLFVLDQLGSEKDTLEQTKLGALDYVRINLAPMNNIVPETAIPSLPYIFRSVEHMRKTLDGPIGEEILKAMEPHGFVGLAFYDAGARSFYNSKRPITKPEDLKGMKIRVQQSDLFVAMMQALGANATPMPFGEVFTSLKTGVVDGAENNWPSYEDTRHFEVAKYYSIDEHSLVPEALVFSKRIWDTLSKEDQDIIRAAAKESVPYMRKLWDEREKKSREVVEKAGSVINEIKDKKPFVDAMAGVYDKFAPTPALKDMVKRIQAVQ